jgi:RNA polymerase sigma-70 factor (ECF subfamily)
LSFLPLLDKAAKMDISAILQRRDRASFDQLYGRYAGMLFGILSRMVEEDAAAERLLLETFVAVWKSPDEFDGKPDSLFIRMLQVARAKAAEYLRQADAEDRQPGADQKEARTHSLQRESTGQKQYSDW